MIELLIGPISSGKSTWAKQRAEEGWIVINDDSIVNSVHGGSYFLYDKSLKPLYKSIENHILVTAIAMGKNVVIDRALDLNKKSRLRWIALAKSLDIPIQARLFKINDPEIHARRRFEDDPRGLTYDHWLEAAQRHHDSYDPPTLEEGFDHIDFS